MKIVEPVYAKISKATRMITRIILVSVVVAAVLSCDKGNPSGGSGNVPVTGVTVKTSTVILVGKTEQLTATVAPGTATNKAVTWTSSNALAATISTAGLVTAAAAGSAMITVTTVDGNFTAQCAVTVSSTIVPVSGVSIASSAALTVGKTEQLAAIVAPSTATNQTVTWTSSNTSAATVSSSGLVTAVAAGTAVITAIAVDGNFSAQCAVTVTAAVVTNGTVTDIDGNVYHTVKIGTQEWTVENFRVTKLNDGTAIPLVTEIDAWADLTTPGYCYYNNTNNVDSINKFGALYNWYGIGTGKLAPSGWHVPTNAEWDTLENYLINHGFNWDSTTSGNKIAKSMAATTDWEKTGPRAGAIGVDLTLNNRSGFSAVPGGFCGNVGNDPYPFIDIGMRGCWWSATKDNMTSLFDARDLYAEKDDLESFSNAAGFGFSVRLVRN